LIALLTNSASYNMFMNSNSHTKEVIYILLKSSWTSFFHSLDCLSGTVRYRKNYHAQEI